MWALEAMCFSAITVQVLQVQVGLICLQAEPDGVFSSVGLEHAIQNVNKTRDAI